MSRIKLIAVLLLTMPILAKAQEIYTNDIFIFGVSAGMNSSTFHHKDFKFSSGAMLSAGAFNLMKLDETFSLKNSVMFAPKRSALLEPFHKVNNYYLDFIVMPKVKLFDGLDFQAGMIYSAYIASTVSKADGTRVGKGSYDPSSELNLMTGFELRLQKHLNMEINYQIPLIKENTSSFQFTLNYILNKDANPEKSKKRIARELSVKQIQELKGGTLLVRLKTAENTIAALEQAGYAEEANERKAFRENKNREIMAAFRENYYFSKIAFFYSSESVKVKERQFEGIFLNDQMQYDPSITIDTAGAIFIGEFDVIESDTAKYESYKYFDTNKKRMETAYYGTPSNYSFSSLVIRDHNFIQLRDPFPYFTSASSERQKGSLENKVDAAIKWTVAGAVIRMNARLHRFHYRVL